MVKKSRIGIFDSGYGGLTVFKEIVAALPNYDYIYLGDNARVPYGNRSFETVHNFTWECVQHLFSQDCELVILACNTASAKALRTIQINDLPNSEYSDRRILGVIRPTTELVGTLTQSREIGILATLGTVLSESYVIEIGHFFPDVHVFQQACPMWVPLVENNEFESPGADYFVELYVKQLMSQSPKIDTIILACTHYPLLISKIRKFLPEDIRIISQGHLVAKSLEDYLVRHPEIASKLSINGHQEFYTTDDTFDFDRKAKLFLGRQVHSNHVDLKKETK